MGRPVRDLTKEPPFGRLRAIRCIGRKYGGNAYFLCACDCGEVIEAKGSHLVNGNIKSCGCLQRENCSAIGRRSGERNRKHGASGTPTFNSWRAMIRRCTDDRHEDYHRYCGRGIKVCETWYDYGNFLADMGERPDGTTINRLDNDGDYEPGNCEWSTAREQQTNKSNNVRLTLNGTKLTIVEWADRLGINSKTIWSRINVLGWDATKALTTPVNERTS